MITIINGKPSKTYDVDKAVVYATFKDWHGCFGHVNCLLLDHDSVITNYGKHDRVIAFCPDKEGVLTCRVDHLWQLGNPSEKDILTVARKEGYIKGHWKMFDIEKADDGSSTWFYFRKQETK